MSGTIHIACANGENVFAWVTRKTHTTELSDGDALTLENIHADEPCLFTVLQKTEENGALQICPVTSLVVTFRKTTGKVIEKTITCGCCTFTFKTSGVMVEQDHSISDEMQSSATEAEKYHHDMVKKHKLSFKSHVGRIICNPNMVECDWVLNGKYNSVSAVSGWPQLERTSFDPIHFAQAVTYACNVLNADIPHLNTHCAKLPANIAKVLISCTLTAFAGNYPDVPEIVDDRSDSALKFGYNRDCDDMAITVVSVFNYLKSVNCNQFCKSLMALSGCSGGIPQLSCSILKSMMSMYNTAAAVICQAVPHIAIPNSGERDGDLIGHVFAILSPHDGGADLMKDACIIESTRMSSPTNLAIPAYHCAGKQVFPRQTVYEIGQPGIQCVKPFNARQYPECISAYTKDRTFLLHDDNNVVGVPIEDLMTGKAHTLPMTNVPQKAQYPAVCRMLSHQPNYTMMDAACGQYGWQQLLARNATVRPQKTIADGAWMRTGGMPASEVYEVSKWNTYAFMTETGVCAKVN